MHHFVNFCECLNSHKGTVQRVICHHWCVKRHCRCCRCNTRKAKWLQDVFRAFTSKRYIVVCMIQSQKKHLYPIKYQSILGFLIFFSFMFASLVEERLVCVGLVLCRNNCEFCSTMDLRIRGSSGLGDTLKFGTVAQGHDTVSTLLTLICAHMHTQRCNRV